MNKYELAFKYLQSYYGVIIDKHESDIKELVERATHKKVIKHNLDISHIENDCPSCNRTISIGEDSNCIEFCYLCGQALDWQEGSE